MNFTGLSLDQAPPISVPFRYFFVAPLFAMMAAMLLLFGESFHLERFSKEVIAATHLITIGFFGFVMLGALTQMLPVIANATIKRVELIAGTSHIAMILGLLSMVYGLLQNQTLFLNGAYIFLGFGFFVMLIAIINSIRSVENFTPTIRGMLSSVSFAFVIVGVGVLLLAEYAFGDLGIYHVAFANIHSTLAIFGFAGMLIIGVSFQVLPMFYVAPSFGTFVESKLVYILGVALVVWSVTNLFALEFVVFAKVFLILCFIYYAYILFKTIKTRKRKIQDITIRYFYTAIAFLVGGLFLWFLQSFIEKISIVVVAVFVGGFILCVMQGMLYKIIPFLVWFHLNAKGYMSIPTMNEMLNKKFVQLQYGLFVGSIVFFILAVYIEVLLPVSLLLFIGSMGLLEYNMLSAYKIYRLTCKKKPEFDMSGFTS